MSPVFFASGLKITADVCLDVLKKVLRWVTSNFSPDTKIVFQQNGAPAHTAKKVQKWLICLGSGQMKGSLQAALT